MGRRVTSGEKTKKEQEKKDNFPFTLALSVCVLFIEKLFEEAFPLTRVAFSERF